MANTRFAIVTLKCLAFLINRIDCLHLPIYIFNNYSLVVFDELALAVEVDHQRQRAALLNIFSLAQGLLVCRQILALQNNINSLKLTKIFVIDYIEFISTISISCIFLFVLLSKSYNFKHKHSFYFDFFKKKS